jgi:hypothetical protein
LVEVSTVRNPRKDIMIRNLAAVLASAILLPTVGDRGFAAEHRVRPFWGNEAMWGYWEFENDYVPKQDWKIVAVSHEAAKPWTSENLIDGDAETFYYPNGASEYVVTLDLGKSYELGAFTVLTLGRPNGSQDSRMAAYELCVSQSKENPGAAVAKGPFQGAEGRETVVTFPAARGRYVTLRAFPRPNANREVCLRELSLVEAAVVQRRQAAREAAPAARRAAWENRSSAEAQAALGRELADMLFCTPAEINRSNLRSRPKLEEIGKLKTAGKYCDVLKVFRDYYFDKLRRPQAFGLHANDVHPYGTGYGGIPGFPGPAIDPNLDAAAQKQQIAQADDLLNGQMTLGDGKKLALGEPGAVDWTAPGPPYGYTTPARRQDPYRELWWGTGFQPLLTAYVMTKDERYLKRWIAYMDDWAINADYLLELHPVLNHDNCAYPVVATLRMFAAIAASLPYQSEAVPPDAFARIMRKLVTESPLNDVVYMRSNPNAWTPGAGRMLLAMMIDEFKLAPLYFRETRRRNIEDINVTQQLPDGTEDHQWPGYNFLLLINAGALRLLDARQSLPPWAQPAWEREPQTIAWQRELSEALMRRATYLLHWGTPNGEYPLVTHQEPPHEKKAKLRESYSRFPAMLAEETNAKLYSTLYGDGAEGPPPYTSEWFPYGGYSIARTGWGREHGYGAMFCSPQPGCGGVGSGCKNNVFGLAAYGMDLLADDLVHAWVRATSPIHVDQKRQQLDYYVPRCPWPSAHRGELVHAWTDPAPWRWHASADFDLMEGVYSGVYANDFRNRADFVDDVSHQRLAMFARRAGLWILTDRLLTAKRHHYEQLWWLPLQKNELAAFRPEEIAVDPQSKTIKTRRTRNDKWWSWDQMRNVSVGNVNLSMYQFTDADLKYTSTSVLKSPEMYDWQRVAASWQGTGNQQIVTALFPRRPTPEKKEPDGSENDLAGAKPLPARPGVTAFEAVTPDGIRVAYAAAADRSAALESEGIRVTAEALLAVRGPAAGGEVKGLVLGCRAMELRGAPVAVRQADFEFSLPASLAAGKLAIEPIYRPIRPVQILPESDVFTAELEVTLRCRTPGVVMTYTLDGSEPTPQSTPYRGPFRIDRSLVVKARAYRPGVQCNPPHTSGTHATATSYAVFTKKLPSLPEQATPASRGLNCEYYEGFWKDLWLSLDKLAPRNKQPVQELFDLAVVPADNRPVGDKQAPRERSYALKYTGYLKVPADGVYTIHAPPEYVYCDRVAGYELQVYVGHAQNPDGDGAKRDEELNYWYPATRLHGLGTWSVPLKQGLHELKVVYIDFRMDGAKRLNRVQGVPDLVWSGEKPGLLISGPGVEKQPIPASWLWR